MSGSCGRIGHAEPGTCGGCGDHVCYVDGDGVARVLVCGACKTACPCECGKEPQTVRPCFGKLSSLPFVVGERCGYRWPVIQGHPPSRPCAMQKGHAGTHRAIPLGRVEPVSEFDREARRQFQAAGLEWTPERFAEELERLVRAAGGELAPERWAPERFDVALGKPGRGRAAGDSPTEWAVKKTNPGEFVVFTPKGGFVVSVRAL